MAIKKYKRQSAIILLIGLIALALYVLSPYFMAIIGAMIIAILVNPIYKLFHTKIKSETVAALVTATFMTIVILLPIVAILNTIIIEASQIYQLLKPAIASGSWNIDVVITAVHNVSGGTIQLENVIENVLGSIADSARRLAISVPKKVLNVFVMIFLVYYFLKRQQIIMDYIKDYLPITAKQKDVFLSRIKTVIRGVLFGTILTAAVQGLIGGIGYAIFGVPAPIMFGIVTAFFALIPFVGTAAVWIPASVYLFAIHYDPTNLVWLWRPIGMLAYGALIVSVVDNFLKPIFIGGKAQLHPAIALLGVLGGVQLFGLIGVILGPLALAGVFEFIEIYKKQL